MKIETVRIKNYRAFADAKCYLNRDINFIIGRNSIGKTSFIDLLETLFSRNNFNEGDFNDVGKSIEVQVTLRLDEEELGFFDDIFSPDDYTKVDLLFSQKDPSSEIEIYNPRTSTSISRSRIKNINYIKYTSNRKSVRDNELTLSKRRFLLIPRLIDTYLNDQGQKSRLNIDEDLIKYVNKKLRYIKSFRDNDIKLELADDVSKILKRMVTLTDSNGIEFSNLGYGVQFASLFSLELLDNIEKILKYSPDKKVLSVNGKRILKLIVSVDEPELHLHPNMQKKTIRDIKDIVEGNDNEFNKLVKLLFNIDALDGQLIIVTHSPNILSADYRYICRAYQAKNGGTDFACGSRISFDEKVAKELIAELAEVKEVMFADKVMLCEGQTEQTAIPVFAEKLNKDLLSENVNIMAVHGKDNLGKFITIFNELKVKNWAVIDKDDNNNNKQKYTKNKNLLFTNERDFEEECFKVMNLDNMIDFFIEFNQYKGTCNNRMNAFWIGFLSERGKNILTKTGDLKQLSNFMNAEEKQNLRNEIKSRFMSKYMKAKSTITGKLIAKNVNEVPAVYQNLIEKVFSKDGE